MSTTIRLLRTSQILRTLRLDILLTDCLDSQDMPTALLRSQQLILQHTLRWRKHHNKVLRYLQVTQLPCLSRSSWSINSWALTFSSTTHLDWWPPAIKSLVSQSPTRPSTPLLVPCSQVERTSQRSWVISLSLRNKTSMVWPTMQLRALPRWTKRRYWNSMTFALGQFKLRPSEVEKGTSQLSILAWSPSMLWLAGTRLSKFSCMTSLHLIRRPTHSQLSSLNRTYRNMVLTWTPRSLQSSSTLLRLREREILTV